jgi:hypothetical protein
MPLAQGGIKTGPDETKDELISLHLTCYGLIASIREEPGRRAILPGYMNST